MTLEQIQNMDKEQLIAYAKEFNIFKLYDFAEYVNTKNAIIARMEQLNVSIDEIRPTRSASKGITTA